MRLWTWQKRGFDIENENVPVKSLENSFYLNRSGYFKAESSHFVEVYKTLFEKLGTCQFHWYFTEEDEAKCKSSHLEFPKQDRVLWEIEVPVGKVFKRICSIAWNHLLNRHVVPIKLNNYWKDRAIDEFPSESWQQKEKWEQEFRDFWESKSEDQLWDLLILEKYVDGCTDVLLSHPLEKSWIIRNPIKEGKWWEISRGNQYSQESYHCTLPCDKCSGRS